jgi:hypothetical protein
VIIYCCAELSNHFVHALTSSVPLAWMCTLRLCLCVYAHVYVCMYVCVCAHMYVCMYVCVCMCMHTYTAFALAALIDRRIKERIGLRFARFPQLSQYLLSRHESTRSLQRYQKTLHVR